MREYKSIIYLGYELSGKKITEILTQEEIEKMESEGYLHRLDWYHDAKYISFVVGTKHKVLSEGEAFAVEGAMPPAQELMALRDTIKQYMSLQYFPPRCPNFVFGLEVS